MKTALLLILLISSGLHAYADNMGYLELRLAPGFPMLQLSINGRRYGALSGKPKRFFLRTGRYTVHIAGMTGKYRYHKKTICRVEEDSTTRKTLFPARTIIRKKTPVIKSVKKPPETVQPGKKTAPPGGKVYAGLNRPVLFIRPAGQPGVRISLFLNSSWLGWLKPGRSIRRMAETGTKHWILIRKYREGRRSEDQKVFFLEKAIGPKRILIYP